MKVIFSSLFRVSLIFIKVSVDLEARFAVGSSARINFGLDAIKTAEEATEIILAKDKIIGPEIVQQLFQPIINYYYSQCQRSEAMSVANKAADLILKYIN